MTAIARWVVSRIIRGYQVLLSPLFPASCRFQPTCSQYTLEAVHHHGAFRGVLLGMKRIAKCHPFHPGGYDPVPVQSDHHETSH